MICQRWRDLAGGAGLLVSILGTGVPQRCGQGIKDLDRALEFPSALLRWQPKVFKGKQVHSPVTDLPRASSGQRWPAGVGGPVRAGVDNGRAPWPDRPTAVRRGSP